MNFNPEEADKFHKKR